MSIIASIIRGLYWISPPGILHFILSRFFRAGAGKATIIQNPHVLDGDTIAVGETRIRLYGMDAPELGQPGGQASRRALARLLGHNQVRVVPLGRDRYDRIIAKLYVGDTLVNSTMVAMGYALGDRYSNTFISLEKTARRKRHGLWSQGGISCPREFRRQFR